MTGVPVSRQDYEERIASEQERLLEVRKDWTTVLAVLARLRDKQRIGPDVYAEVEKAAEKAMGPVNRHLDALKGMSNDMRVMAKQPAFARREDPEATVFDSKGRENVAGLVEFPTRSERFD